MNIKRLSRMRIMQPTVQIAAFEMHVKHELTSTVDKLSLGILQLGLRSLCAPKGRLDDKSPIGKLLWVFGFVRKQLPACAIMAQELRHIYFSGLHNALLDPRQRAPRSVFPRPSKAHLKSPPGRPIKENAPHQ